MSLKGVRQMKELVIRYSDYDGSSRGVREWIRTNLVGFAEANPDLSVKTELKRNVHPYVQGHYANGNSKTICVKNLQPDGIEDFIFDLRNQIGRKSSNNGYKKPKVTQNTSVQGEWHERMDLISLALKVTMK
ncbi:thioredoxin-like protein [Ochromonadaceae sp. CCMP2298]|nr:thioredoxin-like protein [Ochromonadaceae sp. CCMP2298]|mmetsp:Transcript_1572/g.3429  ORF Transcript_1572/g.3429 Transcript_1572/m.3429 type:complete len:132 (+) Transcript_1572:118-513(+)